VLAVVDPSFAALVLGLAVTQAAVVLASLRPLHDLGQRTLVAKSDEQSCLVELMKGIAYVKASGAEQPAYERWVELFSRQLGVFVDRAYFSAKVDVVLGLVRTASPLVLLWYGASLVASGTMPLGTMLGLTALATLFLTPFVTLVQSSQQLQLLEAYVERLADVLQAAPEATAERPSNVATTLVCRRSCPAIEARQLTYRFAPGGPAIVDDVSFSVRAGEKLGIVGPTGSGKSTVLMLLLGLYRPDEGEIYYDGVALTEMDPREVRRRCGVVLQDVSLFGGSIHSNIALGAPWASHEDVVRAATLAGIHNDITAFPMGYETRLAESGSNLSGGQRQRVAIARALVHRPDMLLLDEASSHLDVASEQRLNANLESLRCTRVVVAHRLTAVRSADQILVMRAGRVVERGSHFELVQLGREYAALAAAQTSSPTRREGETWS
jgi:ATP-binding cassette subfamily B protein